jgi:hypothetical protein
MPDVVVTLPLAFGLPGWVAEGQLPGEPWNGAEYYFFLGGPVPDIQPGERVYVTYNKKLRGYAPLVRIEQYDGDRYALVRHGDAVAVTIDEEIRGFRGVRPVWWSRTQEVPFPEWQIP